MEIKVVKIEAPESCNLILGQSHFIKTVEDLYEAVVNSVPGARFGWHSARAPASAWSGWTARMRS